MVDRIHRDDDVCSRCCCWLLLSGGVGCRALLDLILTDERQTLYKVLLASVRQGPVLGVVSWRF